MPRKLYAPPHTHPRTHTHTNTMFLYKPSRDDWNKNSQFIGPFPKSPHLISLTPNWVQVHYQKPLGILLPRKHGPAFADMRNRGTDHEERYKPPSQQGRNPPDCKATRHATLKESGHTYCYSTSSSPSTSGYQQLNQKVATHRD